MDEARALAPLSAADARAFWYGLINFEQRSPAPTDLKLDRIRELLARLGDPQRRLRIIHVAGSKGKGSTAAMLASVLRQAGYRTGLFTSPHLCRVEERFLVDSQPISTPELTVLLNDIRDVIERQRRAGTTGFTFFEVATAVGFLHFVRRRVGAAVFEVGLGGRLDSTNVCLPELAVITSISYDHTRQLGSRLASIATEKAGIIKPQRPVVSGATAPEARPVIARISQERQAPLRQLGVDFHFHHEPGQVTAQGVQPARVQVRTRRRTWPLLEVGLLGEHQAANAAVVVVAVEVLRERGWYLPDHAVAAGLAQVSWPARMEIVGRRPLVVLDCAHNVASAEALVQTLQTSFPPGRRLLVFAGSSDKDLPGMFAVLAPHFAHVFLTRYTDSSRGVPPEQLAELLCRHSAVPASVHATPTEAFAAAQTVADPEDLICITGSVFLAGELRRHLVPEI
jgi:dihydrofolate synthase/folylpolyglutamate synthase